MNTLKLYILPFGILALVFLITIKIGGAYLIKPSMIELIEAQLNSSKREANEVATMIEVSNNMGNSREEVINGIQEVVLDTNLDNAFLSVFDWTTKLVIHPDKTKLGTKVEEDQATIFEDVISATVIYDLLLESADQYSDYKDVPPKLVYMVRASGLIVGANINLEYLLVSMDTICLLYTSPSPRDLSTSRMPSSA